MIRLHDQVAGNKHLERCIFHDNWYIMDDRCSYYTRKKERLSKSPGFSVGIGICFDNHCCFRLLQNIYLVLAENLSLTIIVFNNKYFNLNYRI